MRAPITDKHLLEMMWNRFPEIMRRGIEQPAQRTWVGLTEVEADKIYKDGSTFGEMMRMVEAKLKEKNT